MKNDSIGASAVGKVAFCPHAAYLDAKGYKESAQEVANKNRGNLFHNEQNKQILRHEKTNKTPLKPIVIVIVIVSLVIWWLA